MDAIISANFDALNSPKTDKSRAVISLYQFFQTKKVNNWKDMKYDLQTSDSQELFSYFPGAFIMRCDGAKISSTFNT